MIIEKERNLIIATADSVTDFALYLDNNKRANGKTTHRGRSSFTGGFNLSDSVEAAFSGWQEGRDSTRAAFEQIEAATGQLLQRNTLQRDVIGDFYDLGDVALGIPECGFVSDSQQSNVYKIALNYSKSAGVSTTQIKNLGVAVCALIEALQGGGDSVELWLLSPNRGCMSKNVMVKIPVNCSQLDSDQLLFCTACPAMLRILTFLALEILTDTDDCGGYGSPASVTEAPFNKALGADSFDLVIDSRVAGNGMTEFNSVESSTRWINEKIEELTATGDSK